MRLWGRYLLLWDPRQEPSWQAQLARNAHLGSASIRVSGPGPEQNGHRDNRYAVENALAALVWRATRPSKHGTRSAL